MIYKKAGVKLNVTKLESVTVFDGIKKGEFINENQNWNSHVEGNAQFTFYNKTQPMLFDGYAELKDGKCEKIYNTISITDYC